jgi:phosphopantothenoylcysteine decarboxylase/phosphopantothenate--cysteine ligase
LKDSSHKKNSKPLKGKRLLVNAGPTHEPIDPVRFIGNHSSGKMGVAIADAGAEYGADVELILGPVYIYPKNRAVKVINVITSDEMAEECLQRFPSCDIAILAAAVADFKPESVSEKKIKRRSEGLIIKLKPTIDIAAEMGETKSSRQLVAGFALETDNEIENAKEKLKRKNLDLIILNSLRDKGAGFGQDTNRITLIDRYNNIDKFELKSKDDVAWDILNKIVKMID